MKIQTIEINNYKGLYGNHKLNIDRKNIFIYGENGSGKSSVYYALKDFFQASSEIIDMDELENIFVPVVERGNCEIKVEFVPGFTDDNPEIFQLNSQNNDSENNNNIKETHSLKSFLTYKKFVGIHAVKKGKEIDLFDLLVNSVLYHYRNPILGSKSLGKVWDELFKSGNKKRTPSYSITRKRREVDPLLRTFNDGFGLLFKEKFSNGDENPEFILKLANELLKDYFKYNVEIILDFKEPRLDAKVDNLIGYELILNIMYDNQPIANPQFVLNEAKLTALALSIYLAAVLKTPQEIKYKILFLDDIFIGLDTANRLPILEILKDHFAFFRNYQVFITTYDKHWYNLAKIHLRGEENWKYLEFYEGHETLEPQILQKDLSDFDKAKKYFKACDYPAAGNFLRKELEASLKRLLLDTYKHPEGIKSLVKAPDLEFFINQLGVYFKDTGVSPPKVLIRKLSEIKKVFLNPSSHNDIESPIYKKDIEKAISLIEELNDFEMPKRELILEKDLTFTFNLSTHDYSAELQLATNIYKITFNGTVTYSTPKFRMEKWTWKNTDFAIPQSNPIRTITDIDALNNIKTQNRSIAEIINGIYGDRAFDIPAPTEIDFFDLIKIESKLYSAFLR